MARAATEFRNYNPAAFVIQRFGGVRPLAARIKVSVGRVSGWLAAGQIRREHHYTIMMAARADRIDLLWSDFSAPRSISLAKRNGPAFR